VPVPAAYRCLSRLQEPAIDVGTGTGALASGLALEPVPGGCLFPLQEPAIDVGTGTGALASGSALEPVPTPCG